MKSTPQKKAVFTDRRFIPALRVVLHNLFLLYTIFIGFRFYQFYQWALGQSSRAVPRPAAVEGFLPISALVGLKRFLLTGTYDQIHPAGLTILLAACFLALFFRKGFCGWICPVGAVSNLLERSGRKTQILRELPGWLGVPLLSIKYLLLSFFLYAIFWKMDRQTIMQFYNSPFNLTADARMLRFFLAPTDLTVTILLFLAGISLVLRNFWCRFLCPYGALLGLFAQLSPMRIFRDERKCIDCGKCRNQCPGGIAVDTKRRILAAECIGCLECIAVCPKENCLSLNLPGPRRLPPLALPGAIVFCFLAVWLMAELSGHWQSSLPLDTFKELYRNALAF